MKPVDQTVFTVPGGNCFSACVASMLELPLDEVPYFMGTWDEPEGAWWHRFTAWLGARGWSAVMFAIGSGYPAPGQLCILGGRSPRDLLTAEERRAAGVELPDGETLLHVVVGRGTADGVEVVHDPHPSRLGLLDQRDACLLVPLDPMMVPDATARLRAAALELDLVEPGLSDKILARARAARGDR